MTWKMKVRIKCRTCSGSWIIPCDTCDNKGYTIEEVDPEHCELYTDTIKSRDYHCVCGKLEKILRPMLGQIPHGWIQWGEDLICGSCKSSVTLSSAIAVAEKIQQIKENKK